MTLDEALEQLALAVRSGETEDCASLIGQRDDFDTWLLLDARPAQKAGHYRVRVGSATKCLADSSEDGVPLEYLGALLRELVGDVNALSWRTEPSAVISRQSHDAAFDEIGFPNGETLTSIPFRGSVLVER
jgi:hypothetical protein